MEAERFRMKARMYARLRCFVVTHFDVGCAPGQIPPDLFNEVAEEMLVRANEAEQQAQLVMATTVNDNMTTARGSPGNHHDKRHEFRRMRRA